MAGIGRNVILVTNKGNSKERKQEGAKEATVGDAK
jgi:hypothetical protein